MSDETIRNEYGEVVLKSHAEPAVPAEGLSARQTPTQIAKAYIAENLTEFGLAQSRLVDDAVTLASESGSGNPVICFSQERDLPGSTVVVYGQTVLGLPIFDAQMGVHIDAAKTTVTSVNSSMHGQVHIANPDQKSDQEGPQKISKSALKTMLSVDLEKLSDGRINRQVVYRFDPDQRVEVVEDERQGCFGEHAPAPLDLPELPADMAKGEHFIVNEVLFRASRQEGEPPVNWRALVEPSSGAVLYIRALVASATGMVYVRDPQTQSGATVTGASSNADLNPYRSNVRLPGTTPSSPQPLSGTYVQLMDTSPPAIAPPTVPTPSGAFNYDVGTDDFSAVNAYYHCDRLFRTMEEYGFDVFTYFDGTDFPVPVDHRALGNAVNAQAPGNASGDGLGELRFALLQAGQPVGIATSNRVVWHEFGHALLWDHVNSPNFGFAHSAGDTLAAVLNDPGSNEPDRYDTFPWVQEATPIGRRHDRAVSDGWAWFGPQYNTQYRGEQILSTTLFRLYQSIGGDSSSVATQTRAAQTVAYLIFKAIGMLTSMTSYPQVFVNNLQNADRTGSFMGIAGGALHKVIRWAFEKQGLFQPGAQPGQGNNVMTEGNAPKVDVYIDDGRNGEYGYLPNHWSCQDMWVRHNPDGGLKHQQPIVGVDNFMYVRVKNRGMATATDVKVDAYHCLPGTGLAFPDDWVPMATPSLPAVGPLAPGGETVVGPFAFVPTQVGHECLFAIARANGDPGNDTTITGTIPEYRFVPFDNNIGQRNVNPVPPSILPLRRLFREHPLWIRNPLTQPVVCQIKIELPDFLSRLDWKMRVASAGGHRFQLAPRERREVLLNIEAGQDFSTDVVRRAIDQHDHEIRVLTYLDGELSGGMTYPFSWDATGDDRPHDPQPEQPQDRPQQVSQSAASPPVTIEQILRILRGDQTPSGAALERRIRTIRLEFDLADD